VLSDFNPLFIYVIVIKMASYHDIQQLKELFPNVNEDVIVQVLRRNKNNVNRAVDTLLAMSDETESQQSQAPSVVISHSQPTPAVVSPPLPMHHPLSQTNHGRRRLIIVRGLPGSGKSTLARFVDFI
jgi:pantothenate kinase